MKNIHFSDLIKNNRLIFFFLDGEKPLLSRLIVAFITFLVLPLVLLLLSYTNDALCFSEKEYVGMLNDSLFLFGIFLVPLQLIVLNIIIRKFILYLDEIPSIVKKNTSKEALSKVTARYIDFVGRKRPRLIFLKVLLLVSILFSNVWAIYHRTGGWNSPEYTTSFYLTILFLVIILSILIEILFKVALIIIAQIRMTSYLDQKKILEIKPLSLDKSGSLKSLSEVSLSYTYVLVPFIISALAHYITWGNFNFGLIVELITIGIATIFLFLFPLGTVHNVMKESKTKFLKEIDLLYVQACDKLFEKIKEGNEDVTSNEEYCETIKKMYDKGAKMPVWPFDLSIIVRFFSILFGPIILVLAEYLISLLSGILPIPGK